MPEPQCVERITDDGTFKVLSHHRQGDMVHRILSLVRSYDRLFRNDNVVLVHGVALLVYYWVDSSI